jgi:enamine deaminase RidA (YjgF/YER057c/UK114 family)
MPHLSGPAPIRAIGRAFVLAGRATHAEHRLRTFARSAGRHQEVDMRMSHRHGHEAAYLYVPWESGYGYAQAIQAGGVIYVAGQLSHDERGNLVGPATVDEHGKIVDASTMALQRQTTYANARRLLAKFDATLDDVVEETIYVTDFEAAFAVAGKVRKAAYARDNPRCASTIVGVTRLAFPEQLVEISFTVVARS